MNDGTQHAPDQSDSHEILSTRQGWSVAAMRDEIEAKDRVIDKLTRQLALYEICSSNALNLLSVVNCGNADQGKLNFAIEQLKDIKRRRGDA